METGSDLTALRKNYRPFWLCMVNVLHPHFAARTSLACWCKTRQLRQNPANHFVQ